jgi:formylglycine-generating enzyme required for sulfatase activity
MSESTRETAKQLLDRIHELSGERDVVDELVDLLKQLAAASPAERSKPATSEIAPNQPVGDCKYWAFISYSHQDVGWGNWLHKSLEKYRVPSRLVGRETSSGTVPRKIYPVFRDREELAAASELTSELQGALDSSRFLIVICSVASAQSHWVNEEIKYFKKQAGSRRVLSVIVDGEPNSLESSDECFPEAIRFEVSTSGEVTSQRGEPIAADARSQGDGKFNAKLKILSGLLGVKYDELRQREKSRRRQRITTWTTAIVTLTLIASLYLWSAQQENLKQQELTRIEGLVGRLVSAEPNQLPDIVKALDANPEVAAPFLSPLLSANATTPDEKRAQLHARLAIVSRDPSLVDPLVEELLLGKVTYVIPIRRQLRPAAIELTERFHDILGNETAEPQRRFRAALALADYIPESEAASWSEQDLKFVAEQLVSSNAEFQPLLREALQPIRGKLLGDLERVFADPQATDGQRLSAANAFADYAADDIAKLSDLLTVATAPQYAVLYPLVAASPTPGTIEDLGKIAAALPPEDLGSVERIAYGQRRANAAVTLLRLGEREDVLPVFDMTDDPEALTQFIFRCRPRSVGPEPLLDCLQMVSSAPRDRYPQNTRYALLLALGEFTLEEIPVPRREPLLAQLADWYRNDPRSGVHGAAGWLLRQWGQADIAREVDQTPVPYSPDREWFTLAITVTPTAAPKPQEEPAEKAPGSEPPPSAEKRKPEEGETAKTDDTGKPEPLAEQNQPEPPVEPPSKTFYYTFIVFPAGDYTIGSIDDEPDRGKDETRHPVTLTRPFALLDREVAFEELIAFSPQYGGFMQRMDAKPADAGFGPDWYDSVGYCRWLGEQLGLSEADQAYADPAQLDKEKYPREPNPSANWAPRNWPLDLGRRGFRLPTESEWEVASRSGARTSYGYGSDVSLLERFGWFQENSGKQVHPPRKRRPSVRGLYDLHGNLFEWTHDWYGDYNAETLTETLTDPLGRKGGSDRVYRGGSWFIGAAICRMAFRSTVDPTRRSYISGFRLALSPSGVSSPAEQVQEGVAEPSDGGTEGAKAEPRPEMP